MTAYRDFFKFLNSTKQLVAITVVCALALIPLPASPLHDPLDATLAEDLRHAALDAEAIEEQHGHTHEDGTEEEQTAGHMHGHDPADHSHNFAHLSSSANHWSTDGATGWPKSLSDLVQSSTTFGIERPPKLALTA